MKTLNTLLLTALIVSANAQNFEWTAQSSGTNEWLNDIEFVDAMHGWAVGDNGALVATTNGGETWTVQSSGTNEKLRSVFFLDPDTGWIAGGSTNLVLLHSVNGGETWSPIDSTDLETSWLDEIQFTNSSSGFGITAWDVYSTSDGGVTWVKGSNSSSIKSNNIYDLHVLSDSTAFLAGKYTNNSNRNQAGVFDNLGSSNEEWRPQGAAEFDTDDELRAIHFTDAQKGFAGGINGKIYTMEADGNIFPGVWYRNFDSRSGRVWSIDFSSSDRGMFNTSIDEEGVTVQQIFHTGNAGESWSYNPDRIEGLLQAKLTSPLPEHAWIAGSAGQIYKGEPKFPLAVSQATSIEYSLYPNPFVSDFRITTSEEVKEATLTIYNSTGQQVKVLFLEEIRNSFEVSGLEDLESAVYFVNLSSADGRVNATQKLVKY